MAGGKSARNEEPRFLSPLLGAPLLGIFIGVTITLFISQLGKIPTEGKDFSSFTRAQERLEQKLDSFSTHVDEIESFKAIPYVEETIRKYRDLWIQSEFDKALYLLENGLDTNSPYQTQLQASKAQLLFELEEKGDTLQIWDQVITTIELIKEDHTSDYALALSDGFRTHDIKPIPFKERERRERLSLAIRKVIGIFNTLEFPSLSWKYIIETMHIISKGNDLREELALANESLLKHEHSERKMIILHGNVMWAQAALNRKEWHDHAYLANIYSSQWSPFLPSIPDRTRRGVVAFLDNWDELNPKVIVPGDNTVFGDKVSLPRKSLLSQPIFTRYTDDREVYLLNTRNATIHKLGFLTVGNTQYYLDPGFIPAVSKQLSPYNYTTKYGKCFYLPGTGAEVVLQVAIPAKILILIKSGEFDPQNPNHFISLPNSQGAYYNDIMNRLGVPLTRTLATKANMLLDDLSLVAWKSVESQPFDLTHVSLPPYHIIRELHKLYVPQPLFEPEQRNKIIWLSQVVEEDADTQSEVYLVERFTQEFGENFVVYKSWSDQSWNENLRLFQSAKLVVGINDERFTNMIYMEPGAIWVEIPVSTEMRKLLPSGFASALGIKYFNVQSLTTLINTQLELSPANVDTVMDAVKEALSLKF